jgi:hypothetical protein
MLIPHQLDPSIHYQRPAGQPFYSAISRSEHMTKKKLPITNVSVFCSSHLRRHFFLTDRRVFMWHDVGIMSVIVLSLFQFVGELLYSTNGIKEYTGCVFSSPFHLNFFGFWPFILQNGTKHYKIFLAKTYPFSILDFGLERQKKKS